MKINLKLFLVSFILFGFSFILYFNTTKAQIYTISTNLNIDWQVLDSYTPPFYEGKALAGESSQLKAIAHVEVKTPAGILDPTKLFYAWRYNDFYSHVNSKTGGNTIFFQLDKLYSENTLELKVYENNRQENLLAQKIIRIPPRKSLAILYKKNSNPILTYANAINKTYENHQVDPEEEFEILAEPYYFSAKTSKDSKLSYIWSVDGIPGNKNYTNIFDYKAPKRPSGDFGVSLEINNSTQIMQTAKSILNFILKP